ncbi:MAG: GGDEF domain-containing protein [Acidiferrobacterales bacterium]
MAAVPLPPDDSELIRTLLALTSTLQHTPEGAVLHAQLERGNDTRQDILNSVDRAFIAFVHALLRQYSKNPRSDSATRVRAILIQQRIAPYLEPDHAAVTATGPGGTTAAGAIGPEERFEQQIASVLWSTRKLAVNDARIGDAPASEDRRQVRRATRGGVPDIDLQAERNRLAAVHTALAQNLERALSETFDFIAHIKTAQHALPQADNTSEIVALRQILFGCMEELVRDHNRLVGHLRAAESRTRELQTLYDRLGAESARPRDASLTDELTGIPNYAALLHRLKAETIRAQRYEIPLALAIVDPDRLDDIGSFAGAAAADEVLRCYARSVLGNFRAYDMVARCANGGEFAVLLPNTGREQAVSALHKARHRVSGTYFECRGKKMSAPTFSSGLAWYLPGEGPEELLHRAARALRRAKSGGTNRIETSLPEVLGS